MSAIRKALAAIAVFACVAAAAVPAAAFAATADADLQGGSVDVSTAAATSMRIYPIYLAGAAGDCVLLESGGEYLLMDLGDPRAYDSVKDVLTTLGVEKLSVYLSHFHKDHTGGLYDGEGFDKLFGDFQIQNVYIPDESCDTRSDHSWHYERVSEIAGNHNVGAASIVRLKVGSEFKVGDASASVIGPVALSALPYPKKAYDQDDRDWKMWENNTSLATVFTCGEAKFLTTGDIEESENQKLINKYGADLRADVLKMGHHGYYGANNEKFIAKVQPKIAFAESSCEDVADTEVKSLADGDSDGDGDDSVQQYLALRKPVHLVQQYGIAYITGLEQKTACITCNSDRTFSLSYLGGKPFKGWTRLYDAHGYCLNYKSGGNWAENYKKSSGAGAFAWYYVKADGTARTGLFKKGGKLYDLGTGGAVRQGSWVQKGDKVTYNGKVESFSRFLAQSTSKAPGYVYTGKKKIDNKFYYFNAKTGKRTSGIVKIGNKKYFFGNDGAMKKNYGFTKKGKNLYVTSDGSLAQGWTKIKGKKYYFDKNNYRVKGIVKISGNLYKFGNDGVLWTNRFFKDGKKYYKANKKGVLTRVKK